MQYTFLRRAKSIAGAVFIGLGTLFLYENLDRAASQLDLFFGASGKAFGVLPTVVLAALRVLQVFASDHQRFVQCLFQHTLMTLWPLLLVIAGTVLSHNDFPSNTDTLAKKDHAIVDLTARRSTLK
jgi:hypothetical protein